MEQLILEPIAELSINRGTLSTSLCSSSIRGNCACSNLEGRRGSARFPRGVLSQLGRKDQRGRALGSGANFLSRVARAEHEPCYLRTCRVTSLTNNGLATNASQATRDNFSLYDAALRATASLSSSLRVSRKTPLARKRGLSPSRRWRKSKRKIHPASLPPYPRQRQTPRRPKATEVRSTRCYIRQRTVSSSLKFLPLSPRTERTRLEGIRILLGAF